ncbi:MAG TPA: hypothetical protein VHA35_15825 [Dongiaceae bacterium]|nr:hypothetical protein [Dongiaceae bacterium]
MAAPQILAAKVEPVKPRIAAVTMGLCAGFVLAGCAAAPSPATDARPRVIAARQPEAAANAGAAASPAVVCAEPHPDAANALAGSFDGGPTIFGRAAGPISADQAEGMAQLAERTASIQLLRDQMHRACEAYAGGAIGAADYALLMDGIARTMVTLILSETAAGAFGPGGTARADALDDTAPPPLADLMKSIEALTRRLADAEVAVARAQRELETANAQDYPDMPARAAAIGMKQAALDRALAVRDAIRDTLQAKIDAAARAAADITRSTVADQP